MSVHYSANTVTGKDSLSKRAHESTLLYACLFLPYPSSSSSTCCSACCHQQFTLKACISEKSERMILYIFMTCVREMVRSHVMNFPMFITLHDLHGGLRQRSQFRHSATSLKDAGSIPDKKNEFFNLFNTSSIISPWALFIL